MKKEKTRLDMLLVARGLCPSREKAQARILAGDVRVAGRPAKSAGEKLPDDVEITVAGEDKYVSRGGLKLEGALDSFGLDVSGARAIDVGASTGGFTDCLLQRGAATVTAVDVGYGQIAVKLRDDTRVRVVERTNARSLPADMPGAPFELATIDVSFISLEKILPALAGIISPGGVVVALVKPQFEAGPESVGRGGVVKDPEVHLRVLEMVAVAAESLGFTPENAAYSPVKGPAGNIEFFLLLKRGHADPGSQPRVSGQHLAAVVADAHEKLAAG